MSLYEIYLGLILLVVLSLHSYNLRFTLHHWLFVRVELNIRSISSDIQSQYENQSHTLCTAVIAP